MHQLIEFGWKYLNDKDKFIPTTTWRQIDSNELQKIELPEFNFNIRLSKEKFCTGYSTSEGYHPCALNTILDSATAYQCPTCERLQGFKSAFMFGGKPNENMQKYLSQKHYIYLAYFEPGLLKVGTASEVRKFIRPIEQDALIYTYIAESDGFNIQKIERYISKNFGITETVMSSHKIKYLSRKPNFDLAKDLLEKTINRIYSKIDWKIEEELMCHLFEREKIKIINNTAQENLYYPTSFSKQENELNLFGKFTGLRGRYLIIKNEGVDYLFDTNFLIGRTIETIDNYFYNSFKLEDQISLI